MLTAASPARPSVARAIGWGGLVAGILDITDALLFTWSRGVAPVRVLYAIASGVLGREAASAGGAGIASLGLALHFFIAYSVASVYVLASRRLPVLVHRAVPCSLAYGLAVFLVMQFIVLPLAGFRGGMPSPPQLWNLLAAHLFCVGLPIGLVTRRYLSAGAGA